MNERRRISGNLNDRLMVANRHTCCICHEPRQPVEKHHINGDPSNNTWDNLAVLCRNCHGLVTATGNLGTNYAPGEVLRYKQLWEKRCGEAKDGEIDSPVEAFHETKIIRGGEHELYLFQMEEGDELVFSVDANDCLDLVICTEEDADDWADGDVDAEDDEDRPLPRGYWHRTDVIHLREHTFVAPEDGQYVLLLVNWDDEATEVTLDVAVWETED